MQERDGFTGRWEVIRWTKLRKVTQQAFSEVGKRNFGRPTCLAVTTSIVIGTSKGIILIFDYRQNNKGIIGAGTKATECGAVTSLAISADHTIVVGGHAEGHIFTWEMNRPARPFLHIPPIQLDQAHTRGTDGHVSGGAVLHVGFLGYRHTALVSADDRGMAFSHLATRGTGAVARTVHTTRILGRYPDLVIRQSKPRKASSVLALSPLPLGNIEQDTDTLGLVALMTPYLLVIVSTTPTAQTQHKSARPKEVVDHSAMSAALAWFPAIKLKDKTSQVSKTKLVYCWSDVLSVLDVTVVEPPNPVEKDKPPELQFHVRKRWKAEEAIVAVQWLSRSVMAILTMTQQMIILEEASMHVTGSVDLLQKHVYHIDSYSKQLHSLVEQLDVEDSPMHGVVADAFHMSFRAYKGRLFLLGFNDVSVGSLSSWADRLLAMMEAGDFVGAIQLAASYYAGGAEKGAVGLPEEDATRHAMVRERLLEVISASLKYVFGRHEQAGGVKSDPSQLKDFAVAAVAACVSIDNQDYLFEEIYAWFEEHGEVSIFLDVLERYIIDGQIRLIPPPVTKSLIDHFMTTHTLTNLEEIICLLDTTAMDIDQVTTLCKKYHLYDAYIYVWNRALNDYTSPIKELLKMSQISAGSNGDVDATARNQNDVRKLFPYLSFVLTGRIYPTGLPMEDDEATHAKTQIYDFFFSGGVADAHSSGDGQQQRVRTHMPYPHLREVLAYDAPSFLGVLNEAFEDSYLNDDESFDDRADDDNVHGVKITRDSVRKTMNRQYITRILLEVMNPKHFVAEDTIYLDMFVARNLPKYPQSILLSGTTLNQILDRLCHPPGNDLVDDCQLSAEYLLSVYHRALKSLYKSEHQYAELIQVFFLTEEDQDEVFTAIVDCLRTSSDLNAKQRRDVADVVKQHAADLVRLDRTRTAGLIDRVAPDLHGSLLALLGDARGQYQYLKAIMEPRERIMSGTADKRSRIRLLEHYIQLMCQFDRARVADFVDGLREGDLRLQEVLPSMESSGAVDAAVKLLAKAGQVRDAMDRLTQYLRTLEAALVALLGLSTDSRDAPSSNGAIHDLLETIGKYSGVGVWLCQLQTNAAPPQRPAVGSTTRTAATKYSLIFEETLWLDLMIAVVHIGRSATSTMLGHVHAGVDDEGNEAAAFLRQVIQRVFTALLAATTTSRDGTMGRSDVSFLRVLRAFLTDAAATSPSLSALRAVIRSIFSAYAYEESLLALANSMLEKDLFVHVDEIAKLRQRGWRPRGQVCEICTRRVWGPGTGAWIWEAWQKEQDAESRRREARQVTEEDIRRIEEEAMMGKGKAAAGLRHRPADDEEAGDMASGDQGATVIFSCRHLYHQQCLDSGIDRGNGRSPGEERTLHEHLQLVCPACIIHR